MRENVFLKFNLRYVIIASDNGLAPIGHQAVIWTSDGLVHRCVCAPHGLSDYGQCRNVDADVFVHFYMLVCLNIPNFYEFFFYIITVMVFFVVLFWFFCFYSVYTLTWLRCVMYMILIYVYVTMYWVRNDLINEFNQFVMTILTRGIFIIYPNLQYIYFLYKCSWRKPLILILPVH